MNENWSLHLTLLNNRTGQKIGANYPKNKYEILEMLDRCQIPYGSGDYRTRFLSRLGFSVPSPYCRTVSVR